MVAITKTDDVRRTIASENEVFMTRFSQRDAAGMAELYPEEGQVLPPNGDFVSGKAAIQVFWQSLMDMGIKQAQLEILEAEQQGNLILEVSKYSLFGEGNQLLDQGKYIVAWKQEEGQWKLHRDIFNSSLPAPQ